MLQVIMFGWCAAYLTDTGSFRIHSNMNRKKQYWVSTQAHTHPEPKYSPTRTWCAVAAFYVCHQDEFYTLKKAKKFET